MVAHQCSARVSFRFRNAPIVMLESIVATVGSIGIKGRDKKLAKIDISKYCLRETAP